ncbi:hypothetical protein EMIHUDRAFT_201844 [Emiliania huxleyi CCMP1516]|uniref:Uncharacterized protein n=2 Tax=Emiliania huxleyi TaxID=2903 RepID=A0A0D3KEL2_EMIH1|nr:hypothetical protein EMIHUDRAFT_201844 [Emiliania huxleyi CCMP1516]EOD34197.1 hypothetical protein EMIHUDRAFT_201844 [Emiliania huxleyi CCMP1516]|eukprot:XP_005786626.1 hypothetical protein EMIHUDRAFT_201844 [Emiliania huxleyi CCMP1516]
MTENRAASQIGHTRRESGEAGVNKGSKSSGGYPLAALGSEDWCNPSHGGVFSDGRPSESWAPRHQTAPPARRELQPTGRTGRWHTRGGRVVGGDRRIPSYGGDYRYAREDKGVEVQLLLFESFGGFGKGVREILRKAADVLQNKLTRAQYLDEVTWTTKSWLGLQKQRISVVLHTAIAEQIVNELACGGGGRVHGAKCLATLAGVA